ncbi:MAG: hypothetical protein EVA36_02470 [Flavobacteriales bacterium]|nr:MAG: hypothetical protein CBC56_002205 [Flavobacteriales bacterium TMED96]RZP11710.1 MAG: hypothetical protein EVA36_02470 [Flavobacteriales bacterium]
MNNRFLFSLLIIAQFSFTQEVDFDNFIKSYELKVTSDIVFKSLNNEIDELNLSFESQQWPVEILKYVLKELRENPIISSKITVQFIIEHSNKSKLIKIPVPVKEKYIIAFRSEVGFRDNYVEFLSDTYDFIMERL